MNRVVIEETSPEEIMAMADGLFRAEAYPMAKSLYEIAERSATSRALRARLRTRIGLLGAPNHRTRMNFDLLVRLEEDDQPNPYVGDGLATWLKTLPFDRDDRFQEIARRHAALLPIANWSWNLTTVLWAVQQTQSVPGDFVELGVFKGHTTLFCAEYVDFATWPRQWWLYDTFDGIPEDQQSPGWAAINEGLYRGSFSYEEVAERFAHLPNIKVIKGRVPEILHEGSPGQVAFMHVDMNNAPAEIAALELFFDRLSPGGIVVFDDYCWQSARTQYQAEKAWFDARGLHVLAMPTGQGVFVKR